MNDVTLNTIREIENELGGRTNKSRTARVYDRHGNEYILANPIIDDHHLCLEILPTGAVETPALSVMQQAVDHLESIRETPDFNLDEGLESVIGTLKAAIKKEHA